MVNSIAQQVVAAVAGGAVVLTANKRLFRYLRTVYDRSMAEKGVLVWPGARIFPYATWLQQGLDSLGESRRLLGTYQQHHLWENCISATTRGSALELMNLDRTTDTAVRAHNLLSEYDLTTEFCDLTADQHMFCAWRSQYLRICEEYRWLDEGGLSIRVLDAFAQRQLPLPQKILLVGFDQLPPGIIRLKALMNERGFPCNELDMSQAPEGRVVRFAAADEDDETQRMARWVRLLLEQGVESIGVVVPDLQRRRAQIERALRQQIDPLAAVRFDETSLFGLSLGSPLAQQGVIAAALACLDIQPQMTMDRISYLLRTPFVSGSQQEADRRALFDRRLRSFQQQQFSLPALLRLAKGFGGLGVFEGLLSGLMNIHQQAVTAEEWADLFAAELKSSGWPQGVPLSSVSYQAVSAWYDKVLTRFAAVDPTAKVFERSRAVRIVRRIATETEFQPQRASGPVQVVGLLESSGLHFDHLWVMGLDAATLPAYPRPNPFIPFRLQDEMQMPHAGFSRELEFAGQVVSRLRCAAGNIVFSYPRRSGDTDLSPSPLIEDIERVDALPLAECADLPYRMQTMGAELEPWQDDQGPSLSSHQSSGGTRLLQDQAHCPFRAFVHHRLAVRRFDQAAAGLSPLVRGNLLHLVLQEVWQRWGSQHHYLHLTAAQVQEDINSAVDKALAAGLGAEPECHQQLCLLEKQRLVRLVSEWLENIESRREPFTVVQIEQNLQAKIGPLELTLTVDRVDEVVGGERIIIDYKTGSAMNIADFLTEPLIEPQLPSYAVVGDEKKDRVQGIVVALVKAGQCRLKGITSDDDLLAKVRSVAALPKARELGISDWTTLVDFWHRQLDQLATDFAAGVAAVKPFDPLRSCRYCDLPGLCRIGDIDQEGINE
ncbi:PD-(D/E)XK nuclease family protein [Pelovirga terrestris]|uniref:PD-(D/E)XK nuclease family protein n=1 Tax=Pelovirga terrestris TaxID=2771352 RepID=A0A8J6UQT0_9BACT|nr:PD-(D/E)XK nuclease family protein [Pelovirga terrestris]MBD1399571.1 PD-(D/E)XK nuclease family protein [Pelovirga terrestris]